MPVEAQGPVNFDKSAFALRLVDAGGPVVFENSAFELRLVDARGSVVVRELVYLSGLGDKGWWML